MPLSFAALCFRKNGRIEGVTFDAGDGWNWVLDWKRA
jgi:hypothetical protein